MDSDIIIEEDVMQDVYNKNNNQNGTESYKTAHKLKEIQSNTLFEDESVVMEDVTKEVENVTSPANVEEVEEIGNESPVDENKPRKKRNLKKRKNKENRVRLMDAKYEKMKNRLKIDREKAARRRDEEKKEKFKKKEREKIKNDIKAKIQTNENDKSSELMELLRAKEEIEQKIKKIKESQNQNNENVNNSSTVEDTYHNLISLNTKPKNTKIEGKKEENIVFKKHQTTPKIKENQGKLETKKENDNNPNDNLTVQVTKHICTSLNNKPGNTKFGSKIQENPSKKKKTASSKSEQEKRKAVRDRVRKHRLTLSEEKLDEKRRKDREKYREKKEKGLVKSVKDLSKRQQVTKRKNWKEASQRYRKHKISRKRGAEFIENTTPPSTPDIMENQPNLMEPNSSRRNAGRKKIKSNRSKVYRKLVKSEKENKSLKTALERYKKRFYRKNCTPKSPASPSSKVNEITKGLPVPPQIKRKLLLGETILTEIKDKRRNSNSQKEKQILSKMITGKYFRKYKLITEVRDIIPYRTEKKHPINSKFTQYERKKRNEVRTKKIIMKIKEFLQRDEHSKMCPEIKDKRRNSNSQKEKQILSKMITGKYFRKYKLITEVRDIIPYRTEKKHPINSKFTQYERKKRNEVRTKKIIMKIKEFLQRDEHSKMCPGKLKLEGKNMDSEITFQQWASVKEERQIKNKQVSVKRTVKKSMVTTANKIITLMHSKLCDYKKHVYIMYHQLRELQAKKQFIEEDELIFHIDFAENYVAKYSMEIQSMHFGASKKQISLHTGVLYTNNSKQTFCSVSDNLDHQAHAVWAHLKQILKQLSLNIANIHTIHFFSDGPTSQYKNRSNIYYLLKIVPSIFPTVNKISWNYSESGHGKGPMDGVGGSLKRCADRIVLQGTDITCASVFLKELQKTTSVKLWEVCESEVLHLKKILPKKIPAIPGIMAIHQIIWSKRDPNFILLRQLSCFSCEGLCHHQVDLADVRLRFVPPGMAESASKPSETKYQSHKRKADNQQSFLTETKSGKTAKCKKCQAILQTKSGSTNKGLLTHLLKIYKIDIKAKRNVQAESTLESSSTSTILSKELIKHKQTKISYYFGFKNDKSLEAMLARMVSVDNIPFSKFVTSADLKYLR
ncbi:unnamed protein product [Brassicogethes aeneus]|uniref:BED-type domain-containing protein n=1 Tax=Brassicogethes aeneus TaxID=1431903 RepID=A0A9P0F9X4_BRAAE|nr:unnamed protein product [Brassicogethes aeneus]